MSAASCPSVQRPNDSPRSQLRSMEGMGIKSSFGVRRSGLASLAHRHVSRWRDQPDVPLARRSTSCNHGKFKTVIDPPKQSADDRPGGGKCLKNVRHTACSIGGCERPEYLRQGAVSCWGAGSPAKTMGIVIMAMPFFSALTLVPHDALRVRLPLLQDTAAPTAVPSPAPPPTFPCSSTRLQFRSVDPRSACPTAR